MAFRRDNDDGFERPRRSFGGRGGSRFGGGRGRFNDRDDRGSRGGFSRGRDRERGPVEQYEVTCDKCGKKTNVPFKPTQGKPVYCRECFDAKANSNPEMDKINEKLDKIMKALDIR